MPAPARSPSAGTTWWRSTPARRARRGRRNGSARVAGAGGAGGAARRARGRGAVAGRWRWRPNTDAITLPPTRMLRATSINGQYFDWNTGDMKTPAGVPAGVYTEPHIAYIL